MFSKFTRQAGITVVVAATTAASCMVPTCRVSTAHADSEKKEKHVIIIGGGTGGLGVAAMLGNEKFGKITVIEPKDVHYYQPLWSLVGGGIKPVSQSVRAMDTIFPKTAKWVHKAAKVIDPDHNTVTLSDGSTMKYDYLVVSAGLESDFSKVPGMKDAIEHPDSGVVSIYDYDCAKQTWDTIQGFTGGRAIFTMPTTPVSLYLM